MRKSKVKGGIAALSLVTALCMSQGISAFAEDTGEKPELAIADPSKGIEYLYPEGSTSKTGVLLNGNSVIIKQSPTSTSSAPRINIYNDINRNGVVDDGEELMAIDGSTDIEPYPVYGLYSQKSDTPASITCDGVNIGTIWGAYCSEITADEGTEAFTMTLKGESTISMSAVAYNSTVTGNLKLNLAGSASLGNSYNALASTVTGDVVLDVTENAEVSYLYCMNTTTASGDAVIDTEATAKIETLYGVNASEVAGELTMNLKHGSNSNANVYGVSGRRTGDIPYSVQKNVTLNIEGGSYNTIIGLAEAAVVEGNVDIALKNVKAVSAYGSQGAYTSNGKVTVKGNINVSMEGVTSPDGIPSVSLYGAQNTNANGNLKVDMKNISGDSVQIYGSSETVLLGDADIDIDGKGTKLNYVYGMQGGTVSGKTDINIKDCQVTGGFYAAQNVTFSQTNPAGEDEYANVINLENIDSTSWYNYGMSNVNNTGSTHLTFNNFSTNGTLYGIMYSSPVNGRLKIDMTGCKADNCYMTYGSYSSDSAILGETELNVSDTVVESSLYAANYGTFCENVKLNINNIINRYYYGFYNATLTKDLDTSITNVNDDSIVDESGKALMESYPNVLEGDFRLASYSKNIGDQTAVISNIHYGSCSLVGGDGSQTCGKNIAVTLKDSSFLSRGSSDTVILINEYSNYSTDVPEVTNADIKILNCDFSNLKSLHLKASIRQGRNAKITFDDKCKMPEGYFMNPSYNGYGNVVMTYGGDIYYGGDKVIIDKDVTAQNIYFGNYKSSLTSVYAKAIIPEGVKVTAQDNIYISSSVEVLNCGTLEGTISMIPGCDYKGRVYIKSGVVTDAATDKAEIYYPVKAEYDEKAIELSAPGNTTLLDKDTRFASVGYGLYLYPSVKRGYVLEKVIYKGDSDTQYNEAEMSGTAYVVSMPGEPCTIKLITKGKQIKASKTVTDPSAVLGQKYTAEKPLYDLSSITILNDSKDGDVSYKMSEDYILPEGLKMVDGCIVGTPTTLYPDGKKAVVYITGKNGTETQVTLNIIVAKEQKTQEITEGRITVDEENKKVCLNGTSVVIQAASVITAIYADDNKDGKPDGKTPLYSGDLSEYTIVGVDDSEFKRSIKITMVGGSVANIYGASDSEIAYENGDAVSLAIMGGHVGKAYTLLNSTVTGGVSYEHAADTVDTGAITSGSSKYTGALIKNENGGVTIKGEYTLTRNLTASSVSLYESASAKFDADVTINGNIYINKWGKLETTGKLAAKQFSFGDYTEAVVNGNVDIDTLYMSNYRCTLTIGKDSVFNTQKVEAAYTSATVYQEGKFSCPTDKFSNSGVWVYAGTFADGVDASSWRGIYYKLGTCTSNMNNTKVSIPIQSNAVTYKDTEYVKGNDVINVSYTYVPGYTAYVTAQGEDPVEGEKGKADVTSPAGSLSVSVDYVANQISVTKEYADPVLVAGKEYTAEEPAYDLTALTVSNDTSIGYGAYPQYRVKSGTALPAGLKLEAGKVVGKVAAAGVKNTSFVLTGRNGTSADVDVKFTVKSAGTELADINNLVKLATEGKIDLAGNSVVIIANPTNINQVSIYMDADHDGIADNNRALKIGGMTSYDLSSCSIYGYTDGEKAHEGDISIVLRSGTVGQIIGAGSDARNSARVTVNGTVTVKVIGGSVRNKTIGAENADVTTVNFDITGGRLCDIAYGSHESKVETMNFKFVNKAKMYATSEYTEEKLYVVYGGSVTKDVNACVGVEDGQQVFSDSSYDYHAKGYFYGIYNSQVAEDVNYTVDGDWEIGKTNTIINKTTVAGNLNAEFKKGHYASRLTNDNQRALVSNDYRTSVGNINVKSGTQGKVIGTIVLASSGTVNNVYFNDVSGDTSATVIGLSPNMQVTHKGSMFIKTSDKLTLGGTYTVAEDIDTKALSIAEGAQITIAEGVNIKHSSIAQIDGQVENKGNWTSNDTTYITGTFVNRGTWDVKNNLYVGDEDATKEKICVDNYGTVNLVSNKNIRTNIYEYAKIVNREDATFDFGYLINSGTIVNYGELIESYYNRTSNVGTIITTQLPELMYNQNNYTIYYKMDVNFPEYCFKEGNADIELGTSNTSNQTTSGIEGDNNIYVRGGSTFFVKVQGEPVEGMTVDSVVYGSNQSNATLSNNTTWSGTMPYEPTTAVVNMAKVEATPIELDPAEDSVDAQVGVSSSMYSPLYDLTNVVINNDQEVANGYVVYSLAKGQTLPAGLKFNSGKIYGTPTTATDEAQIVKFNVRGQNQTVAEFTLKIAKVAKGIPMLSTVKAGNAYAGKTLADVVLPKSSEGTYSWADSKQMVGEAGSEDKYDAYFVPNDTANYDWSRLDTKYGTYELQDDGTVRIAVKLAVYVRKQNPVYTVPTGTEAVYGDDLSKVDIPEVEGGKFIWENPDESVGDVGSKKFYATFVPSDETVYERAEHVEITVIVNPAEAKFTQSIEKFTVNENDTLADIILPEREDGKYTWYTDRTTKAEDGKSYKLCFKPVDTVNYDWSGVPGWNRAYRGVVFDVKVEIYKEHVHNYGTRYVTDSAYHYHKCACGHVKDKAKHAWDAGSVKVSPTDTTAGSKVYACKVCKYTKTEVLSALGKDISNPKYKVSIKGVASQAYTGRAVTLPNLKVVSGRTILVRDTDYTVTYRNNVRHGNATVIIKGKGRYRGQLSANFAIKIAKSQIYSIKQTNTNIVYKYRITNTDLTGKGTAALVGTTVKATNTKFVAMYIQKEIKLDGVKFKVTAVAKNSFSGYKYLKKITGGENLVTIGESAFSGCKSLAAIPSCKKVTSVGAYAFNGCKLLVSMPIKESLKTIGSYAFNGCVSLKSITVGSKVTTIGKNAFRGCLKAGVIKIGSEVVTIGENAFYGCKTAKTVTMGNKVRTIGAYAFYGCSALQKIVFGKSVTTIGKAAFAGCYKMTGVELGVNVQTIGESAFSACKTLKVVKVATSKLSKVSKNAFKGTYSKITFKIPSKYYKKYVKLIKARSVAAPSKAAYLKY